ncbi:hypothetical protein C2845_PM06G12640 [Panicum miliaceum]|uniref:Coiled-coil domain-containing protein n=1 Tax=Panicum miliaceum TaxID=4540 RepID=A0A3L6RCB1_PANMI|nr:hypothetical protein C2845_PM06G12640 [Panicum miliaceum]
MTGRGLAQHAARMGNRAGPARNYGKEFFPPLANCSRRRRFLPARGPSPTTAARGRGPLRRAFPGVQLPPRREPPPRRARAAAARCRGTAPRPQGRARGRAHCAQVTEAELVRNREDERLRLQRDAEGAKKRQAHTADEEYGRVVLVANTNRDDSVIEARSVEDAIAKMTIAAEPALVPDRHPERRLKVSYEFPYWSSEKTVHIFEEAELAKLKEEKPGLTLHQYRDMIWKLWKKSPDNPLNQVQA